MTPALDSNKSLEVGAAAGVAGLLFYLWKQKQSKSSSAGSINKYQAGEGYGDNKEVATGILDDLKALGPLGWGHPGHDDIHTLLDFAELKASGEKMDDKTLLTERLIGLVTQLPTTSANRQKATNKLLDSLWANLQHPPLTYMGDKFKFRTFDGSYNNPLNPDLGKAGTPYAKTVRSAKKLTGVRPDPGLLFDLLMARDEANYTENPAGVSSMLFYHASIIIHDIFRTNRVDNNKSDTSSYLDLAPLYGSSEEDQDAIRTWKLGKLKPDTFHEKRLLGQPPGVNAMLVLYNRFHNYCCDILYQINEGGRFTVDLDNIKPDKREAALKKQDNDIFQTARLIVGGLYINISLHDYLRAITNTHHSDSTWTLDPRVQIDKTFLDDGTPRGIGNQVSAEFNLLYRFHPAISKRDDAWLTNFFKDEIFGHDKDLEKLTPGELLLSLQAYEQKIDQIPPSKREFGGMKRGPDGKFKDEDLVKILKEGMEDPAGMFGAKRVPKVLKVVEILGILQCRKWQLASLNEFRDFFGLKKHETMADINSDPEIARILENLYTHPDMVELYPGLFLEETKPRRDTGCGICPPYSVGRAILSDAVTLVRSDRFYTIDYNAATLTNWGITEVQEDIKTLGGSMLYKLIQRGVPGWFQFNSLHVMQPMYTPKMNAQIATEIGTIAQYTDADPAPPPFLSVVATHSTVSKILKDQKTFVVPWTPALNALFPGKRDFSGHMLGGDTPANTDSRNFVGDILYGIPDLKQTLETFIAEQGARFVDTESFRLSKFKSLNQLDVIRDVAIPVCTRMLADLFYMDLRGPENPSGTLDESELYDNMLKIRTWALDSNDAAMAWNRRRWAQEGATVIIDTTQELISAVEAEEKERSFLGKVAYWLFSRTDRGKDHTKPGSLRNHGRRFVKGLLSAQKVEDATTNAWLTGFGGVGVLPGTFAEVLQWFLDPANESHWSKIQDLAAQNTAKANQTIRQYVLEVQRLTSDQKNFRIATADVTVDGNHFKKGQGVVLALGVAGKTSDVIPEPDKIKLDRPMSAYIPFSDGPHQCFGRELAITYVWGLIKVVAGLKNLRPAPGDMGVMKSITVDGGRMYLNDSWSWLTYNPTTWKLHHEGEGKGIYHGPTRPDVKAGRDIVETEWEMEEREERYHHEHSHTFTYSSSSHQESSSYSYSSSSHENRDVFGDHVRVGKGTNGQPR